MPVLGVGGKLLLKREAPEPTVLRPGNIDVGSNSIYMRNPAFWSGDTVTIVCDNGLPIDTSNNGPDCPNGYATYFNSDWYLGSNRSHIIDASSNFYSSTNNAQFYMRTQACGLTSELTAFIYRDQLDRLSFYPTQAEALAGSSATRLTLYKVDFNALIVAATSSVEYQNAITECAPLIGDYIFSDVQDEITLESICDIPFVPTAPPNYLTEYDEAFIAPGPFSGGSIWITQCDLLSWSLSLRGPEVDTTAVGERFGEAVKSIVSGGGTLDFLVDRKAINDKQDSTALMRLLLLVDKGCKATAQFWMIEDYQDQNVNAVLPGDLYYTTDILLTSSAINVRAGDVIAGSADFVTTGEIALRMGTN